MVKNKDLVKEIEKKKIKVKNQEIEINEGAIKEMESDLSWANKMNTTLNNELEKYEEVLRILKEI